MEGKDSICKILRSVAGVEIKMDRDQLLDYVMGRNSKFITQCGLDNTEEYGCGDSKEEDHWLIALDKAFDEGLLKGRRDGIQITAKGKKYIKKPTSIVLEDSEDEEQVDKIEGLVDEVIKETSNTKASKPIETKMHTSQRKLALIQAIDHRVALDDFATNHNLDFEEVMDDIEGVMASGKKLDVTYFGLEVLGQEAMDELFEYYENAATDNLDAAFDEYGDVYNINELHLGRILWRAKKM